MNLREMELFQVAAEATNTDYKSEERSPNNFIVVYKGRVYSNIKYALAAIATTILKNELKEIKD
jgi:hypothetical protein